MSVRGRFAGRTWRLGCRLVFWWCSVIALKLSDLIVNSLQIFVQGFFEQAALLGAEALGLGGKLQTLEDGVLVGELVDSGLFEGECLEQRCAPRRAVRLRSCGAIVPG